MGSKPSAKTTASNTTAQTTTTTIGDVGLTGNSLAAITGVLLSGVQSQRDQGYQTFDTLVNLVGKVLDRAVPSQVVPQENPLLNKTNLLIAGAAIATLIIITRNR